MLRPKLKRVVFHRPFYGFSCRDGRLWSAVLKQAIKDLIRVVKQIEAIDAVAIEDGQCKELLEQKEVVQEARASLKNLRKALQELRQDLRRWFESEEIAPGSFVWICQGMNLSKSRIRDVVKKISEGDKELTHKLRKAA